jgi:hypothetical protein
VLIGFPYRVYDVRYWLLDDRFKNVNKNIADKLLVIARRKQSIDAEQEGYLRAGRRLMQVFYRIIDNAMEGHEHNHSAMQ